MRDIGPFEARICDIRFCRRCTFAAVSQWKGWPIRDAVPAFPIMKDGKCPVCGGNEEVVSSNIAWLNIHGPYNTGLPDYWILKANDKLGFEKRFSSKWGLPYYELMPCERCGGNLLTSIFCPTLGWQIRMKCTVCDFDKTMEDR